MIRPLFLVSILMGLLSGCQTLSQHSMESSDGWIDLEMMDPTLRFDIRYATDRNFLGRAVYPEPRALLKKEPAMALKKVQAQLRVQELGLLIYDAYRPHSVVEIFWNEMPPNLRQYVADPAYGSVHSRGCAVDLSLIDLKSGIPLEMPGDFDEWSERSHLNYAGGTPLSRSHRELLRGLMEKAGFIPCELEWWHYTWRDWEKYPVEHRSFEEMIPKKRLERSPPV